VEKVHVNVGTIVHIDHGKTTLTAAILAVQATRRLGRPESYQEISKGGNDPQRAHPARSDVRPSSTA
jgi:elongation factor Tu